MTTLTPDDIARQAYEQRKTPRCTRNILTSVEQWDVSDAGTLYRLYRFNNEVDNETFLLLIDRDMYQGRWFRLPSDEDDIAYSYLAEKLHLREGDRPGWTKLFAALGIEVF